GPENGPLDHFPPGQARGRASPRARNLSTFLTKFTKHNKINALPPYARVHKPRMHTLDASLAPPHTPPMRLLAFLLLTACAASPPPHTPTLPPLGPPPAPPPPPPPRPLPPRLHTACAATPAPPMSDAQSQAVTVTGSAYPVYWPTEAFTASLRDNATFGHRHQ